MQETAKKNMQAYKGKWPPQKKCKPTRGKDPHRKNTKKCKHPTENAKWPKMQTKKCIYIFSPRPEMCVARCEVQRSRFISYVHVHFKPLNFIAVQPNTNQSFAQALPAWVKMHQQKKKPCFHWAQDVHLAVRHSRFFNFVWRKVSTQQLSKMNMWNSVHSKYMAAPACFFLFLLTLQVGVQAKQLSSS